MKIVPVRGTPADIVIPAWRGKITVGKVESPFARPGLHCAYIVAGRYGVRRVHISGWKYLGTFHCYEHALAAVRAHTRKVRVPRPNPRKRRQ